MLWTLDNLDTDSGNIVDIVIIPPPNPINRSADTDTEDDVLIDDGQAKEVSGTLEKILWTYLNHFLMKR